jgi:hypothetical protein
MFAIESVYDSALRGDSIENLLPSIRDYFGDLKQRGELNDRHLKCRGTADVHRAIQDFMVWANNKPPEEPKWLWISLHGKRRDTNSDVGSSLFTPQSSVNSTAFTSRCLDFAVSLPLIETCHGVWQPVRPRLSPNYCSPRSRAGFVFDIRSISACVIPCPRSPLKNCSRASGCSGLPTLPMSDERMQCSTPTARIAFA